MTREMALAEIRAGNHLIPTLGIKMSARTANARITCPLEKIKNGMDKTLQMKEIGQEVED